MARKNEFEPIIIEHRDKKTKKVIKTEKVKNIVKLKCADDVTHYYANFMVDGVSYQKKNLTKYFGSKTVKQAKEHLEDAKSDIRKGINPFNESMGNKVKDFVLAKIEEKEPKNIDTSYKLKLKFFYNKYIDPVAGNLFLHKVNEHHVKKIMNSLSGYTKEYQQNLTILMFKIFEDEFRKGHIKFNPFYDLKFGKSSKKIKLDIRLNESLENVSRKLYATVLKYEHKTRLILLMSIMLARRTGELYKLKYKNFIQHEDGHWYVLADSDITKTDITEKYPLPPEIIELLPNDILEEQKAENLLFTFSSATINYQWKKLVEKADIKINKGYSLTLHDNRKLFLSILAFSGNDSDIVDGCLSHSQKNGIKAVYMEIPYGVRQNIFEQWWNFLRN